MVFILGFVVIYCVFKLLSPVSVTADKSVAHERGLGPCHLHKWQYDEGRLRCTICKGYPGEF